MLRRYALEYSDGLRYFSWDYSGLKLLTERDQEGDITALYSHGYSSIPGIGSVATAQKFESDTVYYQFPSCDHRGSVYRLTDIDGDVVFSAEYNAFGEILDKSNTGASNRLEYQSNWLNLNDSGGEFVLSPARIYSSKLGRFLQKDMLFQITLLGQQGSYWNSIFKDNQRNFFNVDNYGLYEGFGNNPDMYSDSEGLHTTVISTRFPKSKKDESVSNGTRHYLANPTRPSYLNNMTKAAKNLALKNYDQQLTTLEQNIEKHLLDAITVAEDKNEPLDIAFEGHYSDPARKIFRKLLFELFQKKKFKDVRLRTLTFNYCWSGRDDFLGWGIGAHGEWGECESYKHYSYGFRYLYEIGFEKIITDNVEIQLAVESMGGASSGGTFRDHGVTSSVYIDEYIPYSDKDTSFRISVRKVVDVSKTPFNLFDYIDSLNADENK